MDSPLGLIGSAEQWEGLCLHRENLLLCDLEMLKSLTSNIEGHENIAPELFLLLMTSLFTFDHCLLSAIIFYRFHVIGVHPYPTFTLPYLISSNLIPVFDLFFIYIKVRPHYAARHTAAKCGKAAWQKLRHTTSICGRCIGLAAACHSMLRGLKIQSANCRSPQKKLRGI